MVSISVYLHDGEVFTERSKAILNVVGAVVRDLRPPWAIGGDFNFFPEALRASMSCVDVLGRICSIGQDACRGKGSGSQLGDFVVCRKMEALILGCEAQADAPIKVHDMVAVAFKGCANSHYKVTFQQHRHFPK